MRLNQYIAACGVCSRREADRLVQAGEVLVDGVPAQLGMNLRGDETVTVRGKVVESPQTPVVVAWYKPVGVTCTARDPHAEKTIADAFRYPVRLTYAGRLDRDSEGLLLMTNDGALIDAMMRGANGHEKEYIVRLRSRIADGDLFRLEKGIYLRELDQTTKPCRVERLGDRTFRIVLTQGLNRQIRRMCRAVGHEVRTLKRIRVVNIELGALKPGQQRRIEGEELEALYSAVMTPDSGRSTGKAAGKGKSTGTGKTTGTGKSTGTGKTTGVGKAGQASRKNGEGRNTKPRTGKDSRRNYR